jgi:hypothetical protein
VATPDDFVVIKLDIDHTALELDIIFSILNIPAIRELVDEVYFEYHFWVRVRAVTVTRQESISVTKLSN